MNNKNWIITISLIFTLVGCSHVLERNSHVSRTIINTNNIETIKDKLYAQYAQWKGAKYKLGG